MSNYTGQLDVCGSGTWQGRACLGADFRWWSALWVRHAETMTVITTITAGGERQRSPGPERTIRWTAAHTEVKPRTLCCSLVSPSLYLTLLLLFDALTSSHTDRDLSVAGANHLSQHNRVPPGKLVKPWGHLSFVVLADIFGKWGHLHLFTGLFEGYDLDLG